MPSLLDELKRFGEQNPSVIDALKPLLQEQTYKRRDTISAIGEMRSNLYFIISGSARVYYLSSGIEHTYSFAFEDELLSLSYPLLANKDYLATIEFLETTRVAILKLDAFQTSIRSLDNTVMQQVSGRVFSLLIRHSVKLEERLVMMQTCSAPERFRWLINRYPKILERANITQIASYLGVTKETLYRIRSGKYK